MAACSSGGSQPGPTRTGGDALPALSAAIGRVNADRGALVTDAGRIVRTAQRLDAADADGAVGGEAALHAADPALTAAKHLADAAVNSITADVTRYAASVRELASARDEPTLTPDQRTALDAVVRTGTAEAVASGSFQKVVHAAWPAYSLLRGDLNTWLSRSRSGWYRTMKEAADAYVVLTGDIRTDLEKQRRALHAVDQRRVGAANAAGRAITAARTALRGLVG